MNKDKTPWGACAPVSPDVNRKLDWASAGKLVLLILLALTTLRGTTLADAACFDRCQQGFARCLQLAQGSPLAEAQCQDNYDGCGEECLIQP
jgi:hypothetical protein